MANLTSANVTILRSWPEGGIAGKDRKGMRVKVFGAYAGGGASNKLVATAFGLSVIESVSNCIDEDGKVIPMAVAADGSYVLTADAANATAANHQGVADQILSDSADWLIFELHGYE